MRVRVTAAITPAAPRPRLLLRDAEHHHPRALLPLGLSHVRARDILLDHVLGEPHHRDLPRVGERVDLLNIRGADLPQDRRRRDRPACPLIEEPHQLTIALQPRLGTYPARKIRSTDRTRRLTCSESRLEMVATAVPPAT